MPLQITAGIALIPLLLIALQHGAIDKEFATYALGAIVTFLLGVITHTRPPDPPAGQNDPSKLTQKPPGVNI